MEKYYKISFGTGSYAGQSVDIRELDYIPTRANEFNVVVLDGMKMINNDLLKILGGYADRVTCTFGRTWLFKITSHLFDQFMFHVNFERRNDREIAVSDRNRRIVEILVDL